MKFISNIGWMSRNSKSLIIEILNHQYLFSIPLTEIPELLNRQKSQIPFSIPLKKMYGICTLSASGQMVFFEIGCKKFGTPISLINNVIMTGSRKPLSEIDERPQSCLSTYQIHDLILSCLIPSSSADVVKELQKYEKSTMDLIKKFHGEDVGQLDYNNPNLQAAYMLCYFPSYIENIFHLLTHENCAEIQGILQNNSKTSFYGCGPSPDLLGYLAFLNNNYSSTVSNVDAHFFDMHNWNCWRGNCVEKFSKLFARNITVNPTPDEIDLLQCDDHSYFSEKKVDGTKLHVFQNCTTDIYTQCKSIHKIRKIFKNIFNLIDPGSVVLLNDFLGKGDSMTILNAITKEVEDNQEILHLNKNYNVNEYTPNYTPNPEIQAFLRRCYSKTGIKPRNNTGYSYLIVQRKE
jgi:hypothetical protein